METISTIVMIVCAVAVNVLYHKLFDVTYFGCRAVITEWIVCLLVGAFIAGGIFSLLGLM